MSCETIKEVPYAEFARKLKDLRKKAGITRQKLGEMCGVSSSAFANYEAGTRLPDAVATVKIARFFGISVEELLCMEDSDSVQSEDLEPTQNNNDVNALNGSNGSTEQTRFHRLMALVSEISRIIAEDELSELELIDCIIKLNDLILQAQQRLRDILFKQTLTVYKTTTEEIFRQIASLNETVESLKERQ